MTESYDPKDALEELRPAVIAAVISCDRVSKECDARGLKPELDQRWLVSVQVPLPLLSVLLDLSLRHLGSAEKVREYMAAGKKKGAE